MTLICGFVIISLQEPSKERMMRTMAQVSDEISKLYPGLAQPIIQLYTERIGLALRPYSDNGLGLLDEATAWVASNLSSVSYMSAHDERFRKLAESDPRAIPLLLPADSYERALDTVVRLTEFELAAYASNPPQSPEQAEVLAAQYRHLGGELHTRLIEKLLGEHAEPVIESLIGGWKKATAETMMTGKFGPVPQVLSGHEMAQIMAEFDRHLAAFEPIQYLTPEEEGLALLDPEKVGVFPGVVDGSELSPFPAEALGRLSEIRERAKQRDAILASLNAVQLEVLKKVYPGRTELAIAVQETLDQGIARLNDIHRENASLIDEIEGMSRAEQMRIVRDQFDRLRDQAVQVSEGRQQSPRYSPSPWASESSGLTEYHRGGSTGRSTNYAMQATSMLAMIALLSAAFAVINRKLR